MLAVSSLVAPSRIAKIEDALQVYYLENDKYPESLDQVVNKGILKPADIAYPRA